MILRIVGLLLLFSNLWLLPVGLSQNLHFRHFTKEQGLASNNVRCILQDRQGYLWIGTANGLSRYDGYQFVNYVNRQDDTTSISDNYINAISQDRQGYIWVGTNNALNSFNPLTRKFNHYGLHREVGSEGDARISAIYVDMHDNVWAGTRFGLLHLDRTAGQIKEYPIDSSIRSFPYFEISAITEAPHLQSGDLVIGTWGMGTYLFDKEKSLYQPIVLQDLSLPVWINQLFKDPAGNVWAAANSASLYQLDAPKNQFVIKRADSDTPGRDLHSIFINKEGSVLVG
ncbi:MAG: hypothetical protein KDC53_09300, partial [Saprospiraceae bacterium]|nr:hypothetical protein [Saprospiraceae bacterium]